MFLQLLLGYRVVLSLIGGQPSVEVTQAKNSLKITWPWLLFHSWSQQELCWTISLFFFFTLFLPIPLLLSLFQMLLRKRKERYSSFFTCLCIYMHFYRLILNIALSQLSMLVKNVLPHSSGPLLSPAGTRFAESKHILLHLQFKVTKKMKSKNLNSNLKIQ